MQRDGSSDGRTGAYSGSSDDQYLPLRALAAYAGLSVRTLRACLVHATHPLPHYRTAGKILVKRSEYDAWMRQSRVAGDDRADPLVAEILRSL